MDFFIRYIDAYNANNDIESDQHVDPNVGPFGKTYEKQFLPLIKPSPITMNVLVLDKILNAILDGNDVTSDSSSDEEPKMKRKEVQRKKSVVVGQANEKTTNKDVISSDNDDIPLVSIMKGNIENKEIKEHTKKEGK